MVMKYRQRKRSWGYFCRWKSMRYVLVLACGFIVSLITFSITFYLNSASVSDLISYLYISSPKRQISFSTVESIKDYQPRTFSGKRESVIYDNYIQYNDFDYLKPESLTYKSRTYLNETEVIFRLPKLTKISALLLIFHSCHHSPYDWFHTSERQRIIGAAIDHGYACILFQATDKISQCWSNNVDIYENEDIQKINKGLEKFYKEYPKLENLPRFTFGSSSGGIFSSIFAINQRYQIQGQIIFISIILPEILDTYVKAKNYPATIWIHMLRDIEFATEDRINVSMQIFSEQKIPHKRFLIEPIQLTSSIFHERLPSITSETSRFLYNRFQKNQWLNTHNYLLYNPRRKLTWQTFLFQITNGDVKNKRIYHNLNANRNKIYEFINTIYGEHEISYERSFEALKWLKEVYITSKNQTDSNT